MQSFAASLFANTRDDFSSYQPTDIVAGGSHDHFRPTVVGAHAFADTDKQPLVATSGAPHAH